MPPAGFNLIFLNPGWLTQRGHTNKKSRRSTDLGFFLNAVRKPLGVKHGNNEWDLDLVATIHSANSLSVSDPIHIPSVTQFAVGTSPTIIQNVLPL